MTDIVHEGAEAPYEKLTKELMGSLRVIMSIEVYKIKYLQVNYKHPKDLRTQSLPPNTQIIIISLFFTLN